MADIGNSLYSCVSQYIVEEGWLIILGHLFKGVIPKLFLVLIVVRVKVDMMSAIAVPSGVVHPNVVAKVS